MVAFGLNTEYLSYNKDGDKYLVSYVIQKGSDVKSTIIGAVAKYGDSGREWGIVRNYKPGEAIPFFNSRKAAGAFLLKLHKEAV